MLWVVTLVKNDRTGYDEIIMKRSIQKTRLNLDIPVAIKQRAKEKAVRENRTLTNVIEQLLRRWVEDHPHAQRRQIRPGKYNLGIKGTLSRREIYEDLS